MYARQIEIEISGELESSLDFVSRRGKTTACGAER